MKRPTNSQILHIIGFTILQYYIGINFFLSKMLRVRTLFAHMEKKSIDMHSLKVDKKILSLVKKKIKKNFTMNGVHNMYTHQIQMHCYSCCTFYSPSSLVCVNFFPSLYNLC